MKRLLLVGLLAIACGAGGWVLARQAAPRPVVANIRVNDTPLPQRQGLISFASVDQLVAHCVVNVFSAKTVRAPNSGLPSQDDPVLRRFFGLPGKTPRARKELSLGSGVIVSEDGYILTNNHVVEGADEIQVSMPSDHKREFTAKVVGRDSLTDLAVLKIPARQLPVVTFGNSDQLRVGDVVLACGNPFAVGQTLTMGIVSGLKREGLDQEGYEDFIQTDAAINPGNSGGALVDVGGRLVGINTAILSGSGGNQGIGFAIPSNVALDVMEQLIRSGRVVRGFLGVGVQSVSPPLAKALKISPETAGALVSEVTPHSPAGAAGLKAGDVIVRFNGQPITDGRSLKKLVANTPPHSLVTVQVLRAGKSDTMTATIEELAPTQPAREGPHAAPRAASGGSPDASSQTHASGRHESGRAARTHTRAACAPSGYAAAISLSRTRLSA